MISGPAISRLRGILPKPLSSIQAKLALFTIVLMAMISTSILAFFPSRLEEQATQAIISKASTVADMTAFALGSSTDLSDRGEVEELLHATAQTKGLVYAFVSSNEGAILAEINLYPDRYFPVHERGMIGGFSVSGDIYRVHRPILENGGRAGTLHIAISLADLVREVRHSRTMIAAVSLLIFLFGLAGVYAVSFIITAPLRDIVSAARTVADGNFDERVNIRTNDEIGRLAGSFNKMVDSLKLAYQELESANATLAYHSQDLQSEIAERRKAESALRTSEAKFRAVVEHATDVVAVIDDSATIRYVSPACIHMMGCTPEAMIRQNAIDYIHPRDQGQFINALLESRQHMARVISVEVRWRHANGTWRFLAFRGRNLGELPGIDGTLLSVSDVHEARRYQAELMLAKEKAEEMVRLKDSFLANMSHEIRTPLTGILGFAQVLQGEIDESQAELVEHIQRSGGRLLNTLNSVLDLAELEAQSVRPELTDVPMCSEIRESAQIIEPVARLKNVELRLDLPLGEEYAVANASCLQRVLTNLVSNAVKFTEGGTVTVGLQTDDHHVHLTVDDTGVGISPDFLPHVFKEFTQESTGNSRTHEGSGLGLAITRRLVDLMNGTISVDSRKGEGTRFIVSFPRSQPGAEKVKHLVVEQSRMGLTAAYRSDERRAS